MNSPFTTLIHDFYKAKIFWTESNNIDNALLKYGDIWIGPLGVGWLTTGGIFLFHHILLIIFPTLILYTSNSRTWKVLHKTRQKNRAQKSLSQEPPGSITTATQPDLCNTYHWDRPLQIIVYFWSTYTFAFVISPPRNHLLPERAWQKFLETRFATLLAFSLKRTLWWDNLSIFFLDKECYQYFAEPFYGRLPDARCAVDL